jgi:hypothetical protein
MRATSIQAVTPMIKVMASRFGLTKAARPVIGKLSTAPTKPHDHPVDYPALVAGDRSGQRAHRHADRHSGSNVSRGPAAALSTRSARRSRLSSSQSPPSDSWPASGATSRRRSALCSKHACYAAHRLAHHGKSEGNGREGLK